MDFADLLVRCMSTCPRRKTPHQKGFSRPDSSRRPSTTIKPDRTQYPHGRPSSSRSVSSSSSFVLRPLTCQRGMHAGPGRTRQGNNDHNDDDRGKGGTRVREHTQHTHTFIRSHSIPSLLLRMASQEESKVVWTTAAQTQTPSDCDPNRRDWFAAGLRGTGRDVVGTGGPPFCRGGGRGLSPLAAQMVNPPPPWLAACHVSFCWVWNWPR